MKILIDTHCFLWFLDNNPKLSNTALSLIKDINNEVLLSMASIWEIGIKCSTGKLRLTDPFEILIPTELTANKITPLQITIEHISGVVNLPFHHKDPFDRLIISQSIIENIPILSADPEFVKYPITLIW
jgi:PIN domain nuclease of toxin-antitoxin system